MDNNQVYFALGQLTAEVKGLRAEITAVKRDVHTLVEGDTLAKGGKKMLMKVGALCSTLGAGLMAGIEFAIKHFA